jgi:uncharacterized protein
VSPQAPIANWFLGDDFHHNGALWLPHMFGFMYVFGQPRPEPTTKWREHFEFGTPDGYDFYLKHAEPLSKIDAEHYQGKVRFWRDVMAHPNYDDFWKARDVPQYLKNVKPAVLVVGGWFDAEDLYGALKTGEAIAKNNPAVPPTLVMGPWFHGGWSRSEGIALGDARFGSKTSVFYREQIEFPFFEFHLKGNGSIDLPRAYVFETGRNEWEKYDSWPPKSAAKKTLYLSANGKLAFDASKGPCGDGAVPRPDAGKIEGVPHPSSSGEGGTSEQAADSGQPRAAGGTAPSPRATCFDEYVSDPAKPVPFIDQTSTTMERSYMTADQRLQGRRTDVLVYETEPLDNDITFAGPVRPSLFVSTSGTDSDFVVKLIDVYADDATDNEPNPANVKMGGYQQLVRGEPMRGRFRNSYEKPEAFQPGKLTKVEFVMPDVNHTFRRGHRIMVQVQSTWFPLVDINPQTFVNIYTAKPEDFQKATERVYHAPEAASHVEVMVLP